MVIKEFYCTRKDGVNLYRNYSDKGVYILQNETNIEYAEAVDVENAPYTYSETDKPIVDIELSSNEATEQNNFSTND